MHTNQNIILNQFNASFVSHNQCVTQNGKKIHLYHIVFLVSTYILKFKYISLLNSPGCRETKVHYRINQTKIQFS